MMPKLTLDEVVDIYLMPGSYKAIARKFDVAPTTVGDIKRRVTHKEVTAMFVPEVMRGLLVTLAFTGSVQ